MLTLNNSDHFHFCDDAAFIHDLFFFEIMGKLNERQREQAVILPSVDPLRMEKLLDPKISEAAIKGACLAFMDSIFHDNTEAKKWLGKKSLKANFGKDVMIEH